MGLETVFRTAAKTAQNIFEGVFVSVRVELVQMASTSYDASSGVVSAGASSVFSTMLFEDYSNKEREDQNVQPTDVKGTIPQQAVSTYTPNLNDRIHKLEAGVSAVFEIVDIKQDPAGALWELQLRRS